MICIYVMIKHRYFLYLSDTLMFPCDIPDMSLWNIWYLGMLQWHINVSLWHTRRGSLRGGLNKIVHWHIIMCHRDTLSYPSDTLLNTRDTHICSLVSQPISHPIPQLISQPHIPSHIPTPYPISYPNPISHLISHPVFHPILHSTSNHITYAIPYVIPHAIDHCIAHSISHSISEEISHIISHQDVLYHSAGSMLIVSMHRHVYIRSVWTSSVLVIILCYWYTQGWCAYIDPRTHKGHDTHSYIHKYTCTLLIHVNSYLYIYILYKKHLLSICCIEVTVLATG